MFFFPFSGWLAGSGPLMENSINFFFLFFETIPYRFQCCDKNTCAPLFHPITVGRPEVEKFKSVSGNLSIGPKTFWELDVKKSCFLSTKSLDVASILGYYK